jgi:hypothetical protein
MDSEASTVYRLGTVLAGEFGCVSQVVTSFSQRRDSVNGGLVVKRHYATKRGKDWGYPYHTLGDSGYWNRSWEHITTKGSVAAIPD